MYVLVSMSSASSSTETLRARAERGQGPGWVAVANERTQCSPAQMLKPKKVGLPCVIWCLAAIQGLKAGLHGCTLVFFTSSVPHTRHHRHIYLLNIPTWYYYCTEIQSQSVVYYIFFREEMSGLGIFRWRAC